MAVANRTPHGDVGPGRADPTVLASRGRRSFMAATWVTGALLLAVVAGLAGAGGSVILSVVEVGIAALGNGLRGVAITHRDGRVFRLDAIASFRQYDEAEVAAGAVRAWAGLVASFDGALTADPL